MGVIIFLQNIRYLLLVHASNLLATSFSLLVVLWGCILKRQNQIYMKYFSIQLFSGGPCKTFLCDLLVHSCVLESKRFIDVNANWALFKEVMAHRHLPVLPYADYPCKEKSVMVHNTNVLFPWRKKKQTTLLPIQ